MKNLESVAQTTTQDPNDETLAVEYDWLVENNRYEVIEAFQKASNWDPSVLYQDVEERTRFDVLDEEHFEDSVGLTVKHWKHGQPTNRIYIQEKVLTQEGADLRSLGLSVPEFVDIVESELTGKGTRWGVDMRRLLAAVASLQEEALVKHHALRETIGYLEVLESELMKIEKKEVAALETNE